MSDVAASPDQSDTAAGTAPAGWMFSDGEAMEWRSIGDGVAMKTLGIADGRMIATFKFDPGYVGGVHHHEEPEFSYILEGSMVSQGVPMGVGHAYAAQAGTTHDEFGTDTGCTLVSVFKIPS
jgi:anti-sigma factor ChrR (cupin superfamily)